MLYLVKAHFKIDYGILGTRVFTSIVDALGDLNFNLHEANLKKSATTKSKTFVDGKYYRTTSGMVSDLRMHGFTVEAFTTGLMFVTLVLDVLIYLVLRSLLLFIFLYIFIFLVLYFSVYMFAQKEHMSFNVARMDSEDLIISSISKGFITSVKENMNGISPKVRGYYEEFLSNVEFYNKGFAPSLAALLVNLGPGFQDMYEKVLRDQVNSHQGSIEEYQDIVNSNTKSRMYMLRLNRVADEANRQFTICVGLIIVAGGVILSSLPMAFEFLIGTFWGNMVLMQVLAVIAFGYIKVQMLRREL